MTNAMPDDPTHNPNDASKRPLIVDLDDTLVATDTLAESLLELAGRKPMDLVQVAASLTQGRAGFKSVVGKLVTLDAAALPYREPVLALIRQAKAQGRPVVLASASHGSTVDAVAAHLGLFDAVIATTGATNRKGTAKLDAIRDLLAQRGWGGHFDYVGDDAADLPIWAECHTAYLVQVDRVTAKRIAPQNETIELVPRRGSMAMEFIRAARPHQWSKNLLLVVPMIAAQELGNFSAWMSLLLAFIAFSLCASAVYYVNDLLDLRSDRLHPTKRHRPMAAGRLPVKYAVIAGAGLFASAFLLSFVALPVAFTQTLAAYLILTTAYSWVIKGKVMLDVIWLACLYTLRIIAGGMAVGIVPSEWLLGFTLFTFLSLAFAKRYCELRLMLKTGQDRASGRGYHTEDLQLVQAMGIGGGYLAVLVFAMYINSDAVTQNYEQPKVLWLACPLILYWMSRLWLLAQRGRLRGDPLLFALSDRISYLCIALMALVMSLAH